MALDVSLHPLVLMNLSDQFTRAKAQGKPLKTAGMLLGTVDGRKVDIHNSGEVSYEIGTQGELVFNTEIMEKRLQMYLQIFPDFEFLGWYSTGEPLPQDIETHKSLMTINENPLYLTLRSDPKDFTDIERMPVDLMECSVTVAAGQTNYEFKSIPYKIETAETERISVDQIAKAVKSTDSEFTTNLSGQLGAIRMLKNRLTALVEILRGRPDQIASNPKMMRQLQSMCNRIPVASSRVFTNEFYKEYSEAFLVSYMSTLTKGTNVASELVEKLDQAGSTRNFF